MKHRFSHIILVGLTLILLASCSTTRRLDDDEQLYTGINKIDYIYNSDDNSAKVSADVRDQVYEAVEVAPNNYISLLGCRSPLPLGLWVYNNWSNPQSGLKHWLYEKLVEEPVLVTDVRPEVRSQMVNEILNNNGYFRSKTTYELVSGRNKKKASVRYNIHPGTPFAFNRMELLPDSSHLNHFIDSLAKRDTYLRAGSRYCTDSLSAARTRIANSLRNRGYYFFKPEYIEYLADTLVQPGTVAMRLDLCSNITENAKKQYRTGDVTIYVNRYRGRARTVDTISTSVGTLIQQQPMRLRQSVITDNVTFRRGRTFSVRDMDRTQNYLSRLGIFSAVSIEAEADTLSDSRDLDVTINCTLDQPLEASIEVNGSSKSNSYIGPGITLGVTNKNIFGGGEQLAVTLNGSYEWQTGHDNKGGIFNSYEAGITTSLSFPRLLAPRFIPRRRRQINWTRFSLNADLLNRPHFFKMAQFNMAMSYDWQATRRATMSFTPFKLTYTKLINTTQEFDSIMSANPAVALSFQDQFIPQMSYGYTYERQYNANNKLNFTFSVQEAGNIFWGIYQLAGNKGQKELFGTPFSQFVKGQMQLVYSRRIAGTDSWLVCRGAVGAAHAYGNSSEVPYAEQFYCGGANSVRAFTVRSLGPGSYHDANAGSTGYFDQTGTFKFEANLEWRFPLVSILNGALFVDSGNVWLLKDDPTRPGGQLKGSSFLKDLALGTGAGLRVDLGMIVVRGDLGIGIHAPYETGKSGYYNMTSFKNSLAFHLAIGYPF
jgi:outer membrane protein assembly factor BamA